MGTCAARPVPVLNGGMLTEASKAEWLQNNLRTSLAAALADAGLTDLPPDEVEEMYRSLNGEIERTYMNSARDVELGTVQPAVQPRPAMGRFPGSAPPML